MLRVPELRVGEEVKDRDALPGLGDGDPRLLLVVEDDAIVRMLIVDVLEELE